MLKTIFAGLILCTLIVQSALAVHPWPQAYNSCLYIAATPHRPDPYAPGTLNTPEERCAQADSFSSGNLPTVPVAVITPSGDPRHYCTLDGSTLADLNSVAPLDKDFAQSLTGAIPCSGDAVCTTMFGENASCELFGQDASGRSENGWASQGPASSITVAAPVSGETGAHSIYVRSADGLGHIFYFRRGAIRTSALTAPYLPGSPDRSPILDITFCKFGDGSLTQTYSLEPGTRPVECCGPHFSCDGAPNLPPLLPQPEDRIAELDLELDGLGDSGQVKGMRQLLSHALNALDMGKIEQACTHLQHFIDATGHNVINGSLEPDAASSLSIEASIIKDEIGCS